MMVINFFKGWGIGSRISVLSISGVVIAMACVVTALVLQSKPLVEHSADIVTAQTQHEADMIAKAAFHMVESQHDALALKLDADYATAEKLLALLGPIMVAGEETKIQWQATNQFTKQSKQVNLPPLMAGNVILGDPTGHSPDVPVVMEFRRMAKADCTIFQRINEAGDMLRISTSVDLPDGSRATGTFIPARNPDGTPNEVVKTLLEGQAYRGKAYVVDEWCQTLYKPLKDASGRVVGALYVGLPLESVAAVREGIQGLQVGNSGYVFVIGSSGDSRYRYIISQGGKRDGEDLSQATDSDGEFIIREMVDQTEEKPGELIRFKYDWLNTGETQPRTKVASVIYHEPWGWVIGAGTYLDESEAIEAKIEGEVWHTVFWVLGMAGVILAAVCVCSLLVSRQITKPIKSATERMKEIAQGDGDLTQRLALEAQNCSQITKCGNKSCPAYGQKVKCWEVAGSETTHKDDIHCPQILSGEYKSCHECGVMQRSTGDEVAMLSSWFNSFAIKIQQVLQAVKDMTREVATTTEEISGTAANMSNDLNTQSAQVTEMSSAVEQMSASIVEVARKSGDASESANSSGQLAKEGGQAVELTVEGMSAIDQAVQATAASVTQLGARGEQIGEIIETINDIADQTNLLALNAAIEAARAGEHGRGFAVVADEVRKLADRTTQATNEIAQSIQIMQSDTRSAVERMKGGTNQVQLGVERAGQAGEVLQQIVKGTGEVAHLVQSIAAAAEQQSAASEQISRNIESVAGGTRQCAEGAEQTREVVDQLARRSAELQAMMDRFRI